MRVTNYAIICLWLIFALKTMPKPIIVASIEEPPYDIIGNGEPTIGSKPKTIDKFTTM